MREPTFQILVALAHEERHGYGIISQVASLTDDQVRLGPGTLYGALDRLAGEGTVVATRTEVVRGRERRYYRLTDSGRETLTAEVERRSAMLDAAREALDLPPGTVTT